jgi:hypothetical protein
MSGTTVVEVLQRTEVAGHALEPGTRLLAWQSSAGWHVIVNGAEAKVGSGTVGTIDSAEVKQEEYQLAPT